MKNNKFSIKNTSILFTASIFILAVILAFVYHTFYKRIGAFGCFDDCHTFTTAYFMTRGKHIYSQIFYNHQMLMPYLSYLIQSVFHPKTLYNLVLYHRLFIMVFSLLADAFLIWRFKWKGVGFAAIYEPTKFYLFGDRFLPEALIPYIFAYFLGILWEKLDGKKVGNFDLIMVSIFTWFSIFLREPYVPVALIFFGAILFIGKEKVSTKKLLILFLTLSILTIVTLSPSDYLFDVFYLNFKTVFTQEAGGNSIFGIGLAKSFFYPIYILISTKFTILGKILYILNLLFLSLFLVEVIVLKKNFKKFIFLISISGLLAIRLVNPGKMYYEAFHMLPWYAIFIMSILLMIEDVVKSRLKKIAYLAVMFLIITSAFSLLSKQSFVKENINTIEEFNTGYARYQTYGDIIERLSDKNDIMFAELWDDIIYWQARLDSPYKYSLYTDLMRVFDENTQTNKYKSLKYKMFENNPPDFYYCSEDYQNYKELIPQNASESYRELAFEDKPICIFISKKKIGEFSDYELQKMKDFNLKFTDN